MFKIDFAPYMSLESRQARGAEIFSAFRLLEFAVYSSHGQPCEFLLVDGVSAYNSARAIVPPKALS